MASTGDRPITYDELREHQTAESLWLCIGGNVYDVTKFLEEHPGGEETLLDNAGKDSSSAFRDAGHSQDAKDLMADYKIGVITGEDTGSKKSNQGKPGSGKEGGSWGWLLPLGVVVIAAIVYKFVWAKANKA